MFTQEKNRAVFFSSIDRTREREKSFIAFLSISFVCWSYFSASWISYSIRVRKKFENENEMIVVVRFDFNQWLKDTEREKVFLLIFRPSPLITIKIRGNKPQCSCISIVSFLFLPFPPPAFHQLGFPRTDYREKKWENPDNSFAWSRRNAVECFQ